MQSGPDDTRMTQDGKFRDFMNQVRPIRMHEPLAAFLGAFGEDGDVLEYYYTETVKMAGHACPTVTGAYLCCQEALELLYQADEVPLRGGIAVTVYGEPDEGVYGVMSQVLGFITGAAPDTGFKGLGGRFVRRGLLKFEPEKAEQAAVRFRFVRMDSGRAVLVRFMPWAIPGVNGKAERTGELMEKVLAGTATGAETGEFQDLWVEKIRMMLIDRRDIDSWLQIEVSEKD
ncbi:MAG: hypothetical protein ACYCXF_01430 [Thermoleophilia bacterium]